MYLGKEAGRKVYVTATADTLNAAKGRCRKKARRRGVEPSPSSQEAAVAFSEHLEEYLKHKAGRIENSTWNDYERVVRLHIVPHLGDKRVSEITTQDLDRLYNKLPLEPWGARRVHLVCNQALDLARKWGMIERNPAADASPPGSVTLNAVDPESVPTDEQVRTLLSATKEYAKDIYLPLRFLAVACCRPGEACALQWQDLALVDSEAVIRSSLDLTLSPPKRKPTKTRNVRRIPLDAHTTLLLSEHRVSKGASLSDFVFGEGLTPLRQDGLTYRVQKLGRDVGEAFPNPKMLRHYGATKLLSEGVSVKEVAERLGHKNPTVTLIVYAHAVPAISRRAADLLGGSVDETA